MCPLGSFAFLTFVLFLSSIFSTSDAKLDRGFSANKALVVTRPFEGTGVIIPDKERHESSMKRSHLIRHNFHL